MRRVCTTSFRRFAGNLLASGAYAHRLGHSSDAAGTLVQIDPTADDWPEDAHHAINAFDAYVANLNTAHEMIYNPFSGNSVRTTAQQIRSLSSLGFAVVDSRIVVNDVAVFKQAARQIAEGSHADVDAIAAAWPKRMKTTLLPMLREAEDAVVGRVADFLSQSYDALQHARAMSVIGALSAEDIETVSTLNEGQARVLQLAEAGHNLFIAGVAGTGKTELIKRIRKLLAEKGLSVGMTATTGLAATNIGGVTFHSYVGLSRTGEVKRTAKLKTLNVLIVDEVSMLDHDAVVALDTTLRTLRNDPRAFGGLQMIFAGDALQLEAIAPQDSVKLDDGRVVTTTTRHASSSSSTSSSTAAAAAAAAASSSSSGSGPSPSSSSQAAASSSNGVGVDPKAAAANAAAASFRKRGPSTRHRLFFEARVFGEHVLPVALTQQVRQADDQSFTNGLNQLRRGVWPSDFDTTIQHVEAGAAPEDDAMLLLARNRDVVAVNQAKLAELAGEPVSFEPLPQPATLTGSWSNSIVLQVPADFDVASCVDNVYLAMKQRVSTLRPADVVGYRYLDDGFVLRVRLPADAKEAKAVTDRFGSIVASMDAVCSQPVKVLDVMADGSALVPPEVDEILTAMLRDHPVAVKLEVKEGAKVMLRQNLTNRLINGSTGLVTGFISATADNVSTAIAACNPTALASLAEYVDQQQRVHGIACPMMPVVKFASVPHPVAIPPAPMSVGGCALTDYFEAASLAIPLSLAYASTIHKSQGMTLRCPVRICMEGMWACNHIVYVAMSRSRAASQITVSGFKPEFVRVNPQAVAFDAGVVGASDFSLSPEDRMSTTRAEWHTRIERVASRAASAADVAGVSPVVLRKRAAAKGALGIDSSMGVAATRADKAADAKRLKAKRMAEAKAAAQGATTVDPPLMMKK